jgi:hypothetical protein
VLEGQRALALTPAAEAFRSSAARSWGGSRGAARIGVVSHPLNARRRSPFRCSGGKLVGKSPAVTGAFAVPLLAQRL